MGQSYKRQEKQRPGRGAAPPAVAQNDEGAPAKLTRRHWAILAAILLVGLGLRLAYLADNARSPGFALPAVDAGFHDYWARALLSGDWTPPHDFADPKITSSPYFRPPGYPYLLAAMYAISGGSYLVPRIFQLLLGLFICLEAFWLGRRIFSLATGLVWAAMIASYWGLIYWEGELHAEMPLVAALLGWLCVCVVLRKRMGSPNAKLGVWAGSPIPVFRDWGPRPLSWPWGLVCGLLLGLAALLRPNVLVLAPLSVLWLWWVARRAGAWRRAIRPAIAVAAGTILAIAPATIRNAVVGNDFVLISSNGGINLYIGNCDAANGLCLGRIGAPNPEVPGLGIPADLGEFGTCFDEPLLMANLQRKLGRPLKPSEASAWYSQQARAWIAGHPGRFVELLGIKTALFWGPYEVAHNKEDHYERLNSPVLHYLPLDFSLVLGLFLAGSAMLAARWRRARREGRARSTGVPPVFGPNSHGRDGRGRGLQTRGFRVWSLSHGQDARATPAMSSAQIQMEVSNPRNTAGWSLVALLVAAILAYFLSVLPFFIAGRYRIVIVPLLMGPAAWAVVEIAGLFRRGQRRQAAAWSAITAGLLALGTIPVLDLVSRHEIDRGLLYWLARVNYRPSAVKWHFDRGSCYNQLNNLPKAAEEFSLAVQADPEHAPSQMDLGLTLARQEKYAQAAEHLDKAVRLRGSAKDHLNYGLVLSHMEQAALAAEHLQRSAELAPRNRFVLGQVAVGLMQCGKLEQAVPHLKAALELGSDVAVRLDLANVLQVTDQPLEAMRQYRLVLKERPEWPLAMNNLAWLLATSPRDDVRSPTEALSLAERACRLSDNKEPVWLDTLAAAYAATGQYPKAVETIQQAIRLAQPAGPGSPNAKLGVWDPPQKVQELQSRMELYKAGKAFIDAPDAATQEAADKK